MGLSRKYPVSHISRLRMGTDGEGIRSLVLVHGCPLRCKYCINPATWDGTHEPEMLSADEISSRICIDRLYIMATNGGITFGGGEPLLYPHLMNEIRDICEPGMTVYVETALHISWENIELSKDSVDRYYVDIKTMDPVLYQEYTGGELRLALENLQRLLQLKSADAIVVRVPEIPGLIDKEKQSESQRLLYEMGVRWFHLLKYKMM